ncbi:MAG TPA: DUF1292 domain-containing protein [Bacillota bacterium]|nr:DUF1292 domain-containing protein [Bacillota bacterium]HOK69327.1 DUF1292 domain-containing protein [Bacillota bacterium]HPP85318.1 DUF1292 domain-containing protein [Bacillota bacterium]
MAAKNENHEYDVYTLTDEDGNESQFELLGNLELDGNKYVALIPFEGEDDEYVILKISTDESGNEILLTIDDDDEFDRVADAFEDSFMGEYDLDEELDAEDFDEFDEEEEEDLEDEDE